MQEFPFSKSYKDNRGDKSIIIDSTRLFINHLKNPEFNPVSSSLAYNKDDVMKDFSVGQFFIMNYLSLGQLELIKDSYSKTINPFDAVPIIFITSIERDTISGYNVAKLSQRNRVKFLDEVYNFDPSSYRMNTSISKHLQRSLLNPNTKMRYIAQLGIHASSVFRIYRKGFIERARHIPFDMWKFIPYIDYRNINV